MSLNTKTESTTVDDKDQPPAVKKESPLGAALRLLRQDRVALVGALSVFVVVALAVFTIVDERIFDTTLITAVLADPFELDATVQFQGPSLAHPFGTDGLGRDIAARIVYGSRVSIQVGILAVGISAALGVFFGLIAGFAGGWVDDVIMRVVDALLAFPGIILAIAVAGILGPSLTNVVIALAVQGWVTYARLMRGEVLSVKELDYVKSAEAVGASQYEIMVQDILPNAIYPVIVQGTMDFGNMIIAEAGLSFLGLGPQPPTPSWGNLLADGRDVIDSAWWISIFPGIAIFIAVMGFNLLGDSLRDVMDPRDTTSSAEGGV